MVLITGEYPSEVVTSEPELLGLMEAASQALENNGLVVSEYCIDFFADIQSCRQDSERVFEQFSDKLREKGEIRLHLEEPVSDYGRQYFGTEVRYVSDGSHGYFEVVTDRDGSKVSEEDEDLWKAMIERALMDEGFSVKIGDIYHEDNRPTSSEISH